MSNEHEQRMFLLDDRSHKWVQYNQNQQFSQQFGATQLLAEKLVNVHNTHTLFGKCTKRIKLVSHYFQSVVGK